MTTHKSMPTVAGRWSKKESCISRVVPVLIDTNFIHAAEDLSQASQWHNE
jgi:hypothetical protein